MDEARAPQTGAECLVDNLVRRGAGVFFSNPGTSELHAVSAIDRNPGARGVLCLFEGVATGAADGYGRIAGTPASVLLHLGPGLANGMANLHNARQAGTPMVVVVGEHSAAHLSHDSPLKSDLDRLPPFYSKNVWRLKAGDDLAVVVEAALAQSTTAPRGIVTIVAGADVMWSPAAHRSLILPRQTVRSGLDASRVTQICRALSSADSAALVLGGEALQPEGLLLAAAIAAKTGAALLSETFNARHSRGAGLTRVQRIPYFPEQAVPLLAKYRLLVLVGAKRPTSFFGSPDRPSDIVGPDTEVMELMPEEAPVAALRMMIDELGDTSSAKLSAERKRLPLPAGHLGATAVWAAMNNLVPEGSIIAEEAGVSSRGADEAMSVAAPHEWLNLTGGSIGQAMSVATGAAIAAPDAKVFAVQGDGGALYTIQALWTQARENLNVVNIIMNNGRYAILDYEAKRHAIQLGPKGASLFDIGSPHIDWLALGKSFGVQTASAATAEEFTQRLQMALSDRGPWLIEAKLSRPPSRT